MLGAIIGAGASLLGGLLGKQSQDNANDVARENAANNIAMQREFAQNGIQWKVADAKKAGIHPLYAMGAQGASFSPVTITQDASNPMGNAIANAGQDVSRAVHATRNAPDRVDAVQSTANALTLQKMDLENQLLASQVRKSNMVGPPMPINQRYLVEGQGQTAGGALVKDQPLKRNAADPLVPSMEAGSVTDTGHLRTSGGQFPVPSDDAKQRIEDNFYQETMHFIRNNLMPMISPAFNNPPPTGLKPGMAWVYDPIYGYKQVPDKWYRKFIRN